MYNVNKNDLSWTKLVVFIKSTTCFTVYITFLKLAYQNELMLKTGKWNIPGLRVPQSMSSSSDFLPFPSLWIAHHSFKIWIWILIFPGFKLVATFPVVSTQTHPISCPSHHRWCFLSEITWETISELLRMYDIYFWWVLLTGSILWLTCVGSGVTDHSYQYLLLFEQTTFMNTRITILESEPL